MEPRRISVWQICVLMLLHGYAIGAYLIPQTLVLKENGLGDWLAFPYIVASIASFVSPLIFGSLADRRFAPERLLAVVVLGGAGIIFMTYWGMGHGWGSVFYRLGITSYQLWMAPGWGLLNGIGLMHLKDAKKEFGPIRVWATIGFMMAGYSVGKIFPTSGSYLTGFLGAAVFVAEGIFLWFLPPSTPPPSARAKTWREILGWDAFGLLKDPNHRGIFLTSAAFNFALCGFYIYTPLQLKSQGDPDPSGTMAYAQILEVVGLIGLSFLLTRFRLKWLLATGIFLGAIRFALYMLDTPRAMLVGIISHGALFTLFFMTTQIYIEQRIPNHMRNQAQALLSLMTNGVGALGGYIVFQMWFHHCSTGGEGENWPKFWLAPLALILVTLIWFIASYRGRGNTAPTAVDAHPES